MSWNWQFKSIAGYVGIIILLCVVALGIRLSKQSAMKAVELIVEPRCAIVSDRLYHAGDEVEAQYRLTNPSDRSTTVTGFLTSCACTVAEIKGDREVPFDLN